MKVAILYSGLPVIDQEIFDNHKIHILDLYDCDIYLHTYSGFKDLDANKAVEIIKPKSYRVEDWAAVENGFVQRSEKIENKYDETKLINVFSMFYKVEQCFNLIADTSYDIVIRNRLDIKFDAPLSIEKNESVNVPQGGDHHGGLLDQFGYGSIKNMSMYCSVYSQLDEYISEGFVFHPESLLRHHCERTGLVVNRFQYNIYLRDSLFNA